jgi:hypothetical protein
VWSSPEKWGVEIRTAPAGYRNFVPKPVYQLSSARFLASLASESTISCTC